MPVCPGVRLPAAHLRACDVDIAQFHSISVSVGDGFSRSWMSPGGQQAATFRNRTGFLVEFVVPSTSKDKYQGKPTLGGTAAQPLRFLDFLIHNPTRSVSRTTAGCRCGYRHRNGMPSTS